MQFCLFVGKIFEKKQISLEYDTIINISKYLLGIRYSIENIPIGGSDILSYIQNITYGEQGRLAFSDLSIPEIGKIVLRLLKSCEKIKTDDINALLSIIDPSSHILVQVFLLDLKQEHKKALETHLKTQIPEEKIVIFEWLDKKFKEVSQINQNVLKSFENEVKDVLSILVEINSDKLAHLVSD